MAGEMKDIMCVGDTLFYSQTRRLERRTEQTKEQFSRPSTTLQLLVIAKQPEVIKALAYLRQGRAAGKYGLVPEDFEYGVLVLSNGLYYILTKIMELDVIPPDWLQ